MSLTSTYQALRLCLTAMIALAFTLGPIASAEHVEAAFDVSCSIEHDTGTPTGDDTGDHDHHVHNCGTCHIHLIRRDYSAEFELESVQTKPRPSASAVPLCAPPGGLFRPPRS